MALARVQYEQTVTGTTQFVVGFSYISTDHVKVSVDGVSTTYTWINSSTIDISPAPAVGAIIDIVRETERVDRLVDFVDASTLTESQLDLAARQVFYLAQEAFDLTGSTMAVANDGSYSASGRRISLLGYPDSSDDATNKQYVDDVLTSGYDAFVQASAAANSASQAASSASSASTSATSAATSETNAASSASAASTSETTAASSAATAASLLDSFDDRYLGPKAVDPTLDNDGNPLLDGALYWNTAVNALRVYGGGVWNQFAYDPANVAITGGTASGLSELSVSPNSSGNVARHVMETALSPATGYWSKLATITNTRGSANTLSIALSLSAAHGFNANEAGVVNIVVNISDSTGLAAASSIKVHASGLEMAGSSFKMIGGTSLGQPVELWAQWGGTIATRTIRVTEGVVGYASPDWSIQYHDASAWQASAPTGAVEIVSDYAGSAGVVDWGSNTDGEWVQFADGTQICTLPLGTTQDVATPVGSLYESADVTWTFPKAFLNSSVRHFAHASNFGSTWAAQGSVSTSSGFCTFKFVRAASFTGFFGYRCFAIGRWK